MFDYNFHWRPVMKSLPDLLEAALLTLQVAVLAMIFGIIIGLCLALIRLNMRGPLRWIASTWVELARNTPALFQLFFFGFGLGAFGLHLSPYMIVLAGLT
ncbi:MAG: ABC transporter permease subunit, partial [Pseudomonadota bacterium]|nr:ABC transporter permease subunit [Pseudomonadota bacterium]